MSDFLMALYDEDRDAVVIRLQSGTEVAVMDLDEADGFADEVKAASRKESTGYEDFLDQEDGVDPADLTEYLRPEGEPLDPRTRPFVGEFHPDEQVCSRCENPRPFAIAPGTFLPHTTCAHCGHVEGDVEREQGNYQIALTDGGDITITDEHGNSVDVLRIDTRTDDCRDEWDAWAVYLNLTRTNVQAALDAYATAEDIEPIIGSATTVPHAPEPDEERLTDADETLRGLGDDIAPGACIITAENIDTEDDCTTHSHETLG